MRSLKWKNVYESFTPELDAEHRGMFTLGAELHRAAGSGAAAEELAPMARNLIAHIEDHFRHEERLMHESGFPGYAWHKQQHDAARRRLQIFAGCIEEGNPEAAFMLAEYLAEWMENHASIADRMMGAYLRNYRRFSQPRGHKKSAALAKLSGHA